jgi:hypothetical protein
MGGVDESSVCAISSGVGGGEGWWSTHFCLKYNKELRRTATVCRHCKHRDMRTADG